jgi:hypothetical protein
MILNWRRATEIFCNSKLYNRHLAKVKKFLLFKGNLGKSNRTYAKDLIFFTIHLNTKYLNKIKGRVGIAYQKSENLIQRWS